MAKRFYKFNEIIWVKPLNKKAKVVSIDKENLKITVSHFIGKGLTEEATFLLTEVDKLRETEQAVTGKPEKRDTILFAKVDQRATIPTKRHEDGCYDVYAIPNDQDIQGEYNVEPHQIVNIRTGIASSLLPKYRFDIKRERGSTGSIGLVPRSGQIDSGYRGEWFVSIQNTTNKRIVITALVSEIKHYFTHVDYPMSKAICQAALEIVPDVTTKEIPYGELVKITSERGDGKLGTSGK